jgi:iron complex transport system substrate-binding protein
MLSPEVGSLARRRLLQLLLCLTFAGSTAAGAEALPQADGSTLLLEQPAQRIITLAPHLAELAFIAGAGERLLATVEYSDYPEAAATLPRIGDAFRFDLERIVALRPDLIIAWDSGNPAAALSRLEDLGLAVWRIEIQRPADIPRAIRLIARSAGLETPAAASAAEARLNELQTRYSGRSPISYFYQVSERPLFTLNGAHLVSQGLAICGGQNVFADEPVIAPRVALEAVLQADPDVLIAPSIPGAPDPLAQWDDWPRMQAVRNQAKILLPADEISRATVRTLDALALACRQLDRLRQSQTEETDP